MAGEEDEDEDEDTDGEMMAVEQDGQQYVVLEVIQLQVKLTNCVELSIAREST
jgi:hypothetical protein